MGRTVRDTLFLSRYALSALPWMFVLYGVASAITVLLYAQVADRFPRDRVIVGWCGLGIVTYLGTWAVVRQGATWIYPSFYVWSEVFANLAISQSWTLANDLHDARSAKRLFGTIGAGRAVLDAEPRSASATALEDTEVLRIGSEAFYEVLREQVEIAEGVIRLLSQRLREANLAIESAKR